MMNTRPKRPSANQTREKILNAAKEIFLDKGFDNSNIRDIAKIAKVNTNLIFHHFTNKETLWNKVKDFILGEDLPSPKYKTNSARDFFKSVLDYRFDLYGKHPDFAKLIKWEPTAKQHADIISQQDYSPFRWITLIKELQKKGELLKNKDPEQIMVFIIFSSYAPFFQNFVTMNDKEQKKYKKMILNMCCSEFASEK